MNTKPVLKSQFALILISMIVYTSWATWHQPVARWQGLTAGPDRYWTFATLLDAYFGILTFYVWVCTKEQRSRARLGWFTAIIPLVNMAMSAYVLRQLMRLRPEQTPAELLSARNA